MNLPSPAEQLASRRRLNALFRPALGYQAPLRQPFVEDPDAPRCAWPKTVDPAFVKRVPVSISMIVGAVCDYYGVKLIDLMSHRKTADITRPRQVAMYLARKMTPKSQPDIGRRFGGRDHTTVLHGVKKIEALKEVDQVLAADLQALTREIEHRCKISGAVSREA